MAPGTLMTDPISAISLGLALTFGTAGLPHILLRFFTVADAKEARKSVLYANGFIGFSATTLGILAIVLSIAFEMQDAAFMVGLAFASANFPILLLSIFWKGLTTRGAVAGSLIGLTISLVAVLLWPTIWVDRLGNEKAIFLYIYLSLFSIPAAFLSCFLFSVTDKSIPAAAERATAELQSSCRRLGSMRKERCFRQHTCLN